jgi:transposase InsO family protein
MSYDPVREERGAEAWRREYNENRPHRALGDKRRTSSGNGKLTLASAGAEKLSD